MERLFARQRRSEEHTSELQSRQYLVCRLLLEKKKHILKNAPTLRALRCCPRRRSPPLPLSLCFHLLSQVLYPLCVILRCVFFFNDTATTEIYTLSLHDALPIRCAAPEAPRPVGPDRRVAAGVVEVPARAADRKSTRLNSSHANISYAVFCL